MQIRNMTDFKGQDELLGNSVKCYQCTIFPDIILLLFKKRFK